MASTVVSSFSALSGEAVCTQIGVYAPDHIYSAAAVFYVPIPAEGETLPASAVRSVVLGKPVIDFTVAQDGNVWALLDAEWETAPDAPPAEQTSPVRLLVWQGTTVRHPAASLTSAAR